MRVRIRKGDRKNREVSSGLDMNNAVRKRKYFATRSMFDRNRSSLAFVPVSTSHVPLI